MHSFLLLSIFHYIIECYAVKPKKVEEIRKWEKNKTKTEEMIYRMNASIPYRVILVFPLLLSGLDLFRFL